MNESNSDPLVAPVVGGTPEVLAAKLDELADALDHARLEVREVYVRDAEAGRTCREAAVQLRALVPRPEPREPEPAMRALASAMRKLLPPPLFDEVLAHLDPVTPFVNFLREDDTAVRPASAPSRPLEEAEQRLHRQVSHEMTLREFSELTVDEASVIRRQAKWIVRVLVPGGDPK